jgi:hypothetical protein
VTVLILANLLATAIRFVIYRHWVFRRRAPATEAVPRPAPAGPGGAAAASHASATVLSFPQSTRQ